MLRTRVGFLTSLLLLVPVALGSCGPLPEPVAIQETNGVVDEPAVEEVTAAAEVEVAASATPPARTPEPESTKTLPAQSPEPELEGLWYPLRLEPSTVDPQGVMDPKSSLVIDQLFEGLYEYRGDGAIEPTGATGFEVSDDGLLYTIHLRPEVVWSDGQPVVAQHYVDGVIRLLDPERGWGYGYLLYDIEGAEAFNDGESTDPATVGIRAVDDHTLEVRLAAPAAHFEMLLAYGTFYPVRLDILEEQGDLWTGPGEYPSNGPYLLEGWDHGQQIVLVKNPTYWNADQVEIDTVRMPIVPAVADTLEMYENGALHSTGEANLSDDSLAEDVDRILADPVLSQELRVVPRPGVFYIGLNTLRSPTDDLLVRKALASAIDRRSLIETTQMLWRSPLSCTTPPKIMAHQEWGTCGYTFDLEGARQYLAEAGYPGGDGFPPLKLWAAWAFGHGDTAQAVAAMWQEHLGIKADVQIEDWDPYLEYLDGCEDSQEALAACKLNAYLMGWIMDYGDPQNQLEVVFAPDSGVQCTGWQSERYEELMALARTEPDTAQRAEYYKEADRILSEEEVAIIPLWAYEWVTLVKEGLTFELPPFGSPAFKHWALP
jgi:oligopeptide transport system substrate-binding protein